jgi:hypothetical protein
VSHVPHLIGDVRGLNEEVVGCIGATSARPFEIDHRIDQDISDVDPFGAHFPRDRLGEDPLRRLGWSEAREITLASQSGSIARGDDGALARLDHERRHTSRKMQKRHDIDLEIALDDGRINFQEISERSADGVVKHDMGQAKFRKDLVKCFIETGSIRYIDGKCLCARNFRLDLRQPFLISRYHGDVVTALDETSNDRGSGPGADARYQQTLPAH